MRSTLIILLTLCLFHNTTKAQSFESSSLDTLLNRLARHNKAMGSVLISQKGKVVYQRGFGDAVLGKHAAGPETVYRIGSISKTFTAALVFRLIEDKKISLTDHLAKWYPKIPNAAKITIDDLLSHHSGIHSLTEDSTFMEWQSSPRSKQEVLTRIASYKPDFEPGEKAEYSNSNFIILGYIIEAVTGKRYAEVLRARLTQPLRLSHTTFAAAIHPERGEALPYSISNGAWLPDTPSSTEVAGGAGGISSTVGDMAKFLEALFLRHYLSDASLIKMKELRGPLGRGLLRFPFYNDYAYGHNGRIDNFSTSLCFFPKDSTVVSVAVNALNYNFNDILIGVLSLYYGKPYKMPDFNRAAAKVNPAALKKLEGVYTSKDISMDITIRATETGITAQGTGQGAFPLEPVSETEFVNDEVGVSLTFTGKGEAAEGFTLSQGGARVPFKRKAQ